jgi:hypothetical protein
VVDNTTSDERRQPTIRREGKQGRGRQRRGQRGGRRLLAAAPNNGAWYQQGGQLRRPQGSQGTCGCIGGGWMWPAVAWEFGKVER